MAVSRVPVTEIKKIAGTWACLHSYSQRITRDPQFITAQVSEPAHERRPGRLSAPFGYAWCRRATLLRQSEAATRLGSGDGSYLPVELLDGAQYDSHFVLPAILLQGNGHGIHRGTVELR